MLLVHVLFFLLLGSSVGALPFNHGPHFRPHLEEFCIDHRGGYAKSEGAESGVICHWHDPHFSPLQLTGIERHAGLWYREPTKVSRTSINFHASNTFRRIVTISSRSVLKEQYAFTKWVNSLGK